MGQNFSLVDPSNHTVAKFEVDEASIGYIEGKCYLYILDEFQLFAKVYCEWDACTVWWFFGKKYEDSDKYYHICGNQAFDDYIRIMCFVWAVVCHIMTSLTKRDDRECAVVIRENYFKTEITRELMDLMLDGYLITTDDVDISKVIRLTDLKIGN